MPDCACGALSENQLLEHYTTESRQRYSETIEGIVSLGKCLIEAKARLSPESWKLFTETDRCPVTNSVACRFMRIAQNQNIVNRDNWLFLPLGWNVLYEIALLTNDQFENGIRQHKITSGARIDDIRQLADRADNSSTNIGTFARAEEN